MTTLDELRRQATLLKRAYGAGDAAAVTRVRVFLPDGAEPLKHADFLHVIARENSFESWPRLKAMADTQGMDRAAQQQRLKIALYHGQTHVIERLLSNSPDLAQGILGLEIALYDVKAARAALERAPNRATEMLGPRRAILHLAFSQYHRLRPDLVPDMLALADLLLAHGADVNDAEVQDGAPLSALYGALGHSNNLPLARWLLDHGANPNDNESLYHATELGHHDGLRLLLEHGAVPDGTNALLRAMDFNDHGAVALLLDAGASANGINGQIPPLHQAARRGCDAAMADLILGAKANPNARWRGCSAYGMARVFANTAVAQRIAEVGGDTTLSPVEMLLARAADGQDSPDQHIEPAHLPPVFDHLLSDLLSSNAQLDHIKALVALGLPFDRPGPMGVPPAQQAGWLGRAEWIAYFLTLGPDLSHRNDYGGTLLGTIIHGSENAPKEPDVDHVACARLALEHGLTLPRRTIDLAGDPDMRAFLADWAARWPGQVVEGVSA